MDIVRSCHKCDICIINNNTPVWGYGSSNTDIMFIGEAPGATERRLGKPFVGKAGEALRAILDLYGFDNTNSYITNIVKCKPPNNREPELKEINNCLPYLEYEIREIKPQFVILLGNTALRTFFNNQELLISRNNGKFIITNKKVIMAMYHPSYLLRNKDKLGEFENAMNNLLFLYRLVNPLHTTKL